MFNRYLVYNKAGVQIAILLALLGMSIIIGSFVFPSIVQSYLGISIQTFQNSPNFLGIDIEKVKAVHSINLLFVFFIPSILFAYLAHPSPTSYLGLQPKNISYTWLWSITLFLIAIPCTNFLQEWNTSLSILQKIKISEEAIALKYAAIEKATTTQQLLNSILFICLIPALFEELFFRGCLQRVLIGVFSKNHWIALILVALIFSLMHMQFTAFVPRVFLGLLLGVVYYFTNNLWLSILLHFINNFTVVFTMYLFYSGRTNFNFEKLPTTPIWLALGSFIAVVGFGYYFYKNRKPFIITNINNTPTS